MRLRKDLTELTANDFEQYPIWMPIGSSYASEEDELPSDMATTKTPYTEAYEEGQLLVSPFVLLVKAEFTLADGSRFTGYVKAGASNSSATILTEAGRIAFYSGIKIPTQDQMLSDYALLGKTGSQVFPIYYHRIISVAGSPSDGVLEGFYYMADSGEGYQLQVIH